MEKDREEEGEGEEKSYTTGLPWILIWTRGASWSNPLAESGLHASLENVGGEGAIAIDIV